MSVRTAMPCLLGVVEARAALRRRTAALDDQVINEKEDQRADERADETGRLARRIPVQHASEERGEDRTGDAERRRQEESLRPGSVRDELGQYADDETDQD